jgi:hypothetical protein
MAMIPSYQDMLAQALQQQPQQQQSMAQSQQSRSIFDNPAFGSALTRMGVTMLANSGQGLSTGEAFGQGGLAFLDERQRYAQEQRQAMLDQQQKQLQDAQLARAQLQDNLSRLGMQREAMQYDAAAQQAQGLPQDYQGLASIDPMMALKQQMADRINQQEAERKFAQQVQLQNMQYGNQRALAQEQSQSALAQKMYENQAKQQQAMAALGLFGQGTDEQGKETNKIPPYLQKAAALATTGDVAATINARASAEEEKATAEQQLRGIQSQNQSLKSTIDQTKNLAQGWGFTANTGLVQYFPNIIKGPEQEQLAANIEMIKSNTTLQQLVEAKKSGVTFGALSEGELNTVATAIAKLDATNDPKVIKNSLDVIENNFDKIYQNTEKDYKRQYGVKVQSPNMSTKGSDLIFNANTGRVE